MKRDYIKQVFTNLKQLKETGIYYTGIKNKGEYKWWHNNGQLGEHCFYKDGELEGEYKDWYNNGQMWIHSFWKDSLRNGEYKEWYDNGEINTHYFYKQGEKIDMPDNIKKGYILVDGKYYKD